jgi:hypothetical protein
LINDEPNPTSREKKSRGPGNINCSKRKKRIDEQKHDNWVETYCRTGGVQGGRRDVHLAVTRQMPRQAQEQVEESWVSEEQPRKMEFQRRIGNGGCG